MVRRSQSSAAGVLALLSEPDHAFKQHALDTLIPLVPQFWAEISEHIALIESLHENDDIPKHARDSAALLASKVYYFLGEYDEALSFALGAGPAFEVEARACGSEEYAETVLSKAIDRYMQVRSEEQTGKSEKVDPRLQSVIENIYARCIEEREYKQAIGIALESRRLDVIARIYSQTKDTSLLSYAMECVLDTGFSLSYRDQVLSFLFPLFPAPVAGDSSPHVHSLTRLLVILSSPSLTVSFINSLVPKEKLLAYQFAFDLVEGGSQDFLESVRTDLPEGDSDTKEIYDKLKQILTGQESVKLYLQFLKRNSQTDLLILKNTKDVLEARSSIYHTALTLQNAFMHAGTTSDIFLHENLDWLGLASNWSKFSATAALGVIHKGYFEQGMTIVGPYLPQSGGESNIQGAAYSEGGALYALGLINTGCGGEVIGYLRDTLKAAQGEVVQHGAALGLGVAAMGSKSLDAFEDLKNTLFTDSAVAGEACGYAMGLIMLGTAAAESVREMLVYARETQHEKIIRGLAVGVAFIYYGRQEEADETIKLLLAEKDPILRYGGVYTLALAYAGTSNNDAVRQLLHIAVSDTSDDVRRAAVTSLAFLLFKNPAQVPRIVQLLSESYNPHVRCGATLALGIACAGTGLQDAVEILEPMTKDSVDFVRQGAFIALGMILVQQSEASCSSLASTRALYHKVISDKHEDPMARFGAALGQGFIDAGGRNVTISLQSRAGSRNTNAIVGMVMFCQFWYWYPLAHCACLSFDPTGIIGLNADLKAPKFELVSNARPSLFAYPPSTKPPKKEAVSKVATAVLSTTAKVKAREKKKAASDENAMDTDDKLEGKKEADGDVEMKIDDQPSGKDAGDISPINGSISNLAEDGKPSSKPTKKAEPSFEMLLNLSRVTPAQLAYITFPPESRFQPVRAVSANPVPRGKAGAAAGKTPTAGLVSEKYAGGGCILIMTDLRPEEEADLIDFEPIVQAPAQPAPEPVNAASAPVEGPHIALDETSPEAGPPEPFEVYTIADEDLLVKRLVDYDIICTMRERTKISASLMDRLPKLRLIATTGMRNFAIDVEHAKKRGISVSGTDSSSASTLEHIWAMLLATVRHIVTENANIKAKNPQWQTLVPFGLAGKTLGLIGVGRLGAQTAAASSTSTFMASGIAKAFNMRVIGWSPNLNAERATAAGVEFIATKAQLLQESDIVSLHMVLSERTHHLVKAEDLALMKSTAYIVNTSRGPLIDEAALLAALKAKAIAGGGLDVYDTEPLPLDHPLRDLDNVTLSPHNGYANDSSYKVENIEAFLDGHPKRLL
ncbi:D-isomer specific 2-hydroxyacid dehydrogenase [Mycena pura]|uniref:26S proteasome regulatory subunit RPN2 n=1 Tax=Mycena pura TaxID=153505 RepID=A0AAD6YPL9_9AGAR|nr:D-isomer specific 2-hydroxyacid dehydrogenase [Mycena pura]